MASEGLNEPLHLSTKQPLANAEPQRLSCTGFIRSRSRQDNIGFARAVRPSGITEVMRVPHQVRSIVGFAIAASSIFAAQTYVASASTISNLNGMTVAKTITANWENFFSGKTSAKTKISLLQNRTKFATVISAQASSSLTRSATATVSNVFNLKALSASVRYTIDLGGQPALSNALGTAVWQDGIWKVSDASFCSLLALEQVKTPMCPVAK
jgi:hypothetical protein